jgi:hypothetical protein
MNAIKQRIAIAEACGFSPKTDRHKPMWVTPDGRTLVTMPDHLPDYLNDLNAMHEAEKMLDARQLYNYENELARLCNLTVATSMTSAFRWHATAAQRAEAFLKTLNLWKEN